MSTNLQNQDIAADLLQRKSLLIIQAQFQKALAQHSEAARLFLEAAILEERIAIRFRQEGHKEDAAISFFSAASCYKNASQVTKAKSMAEEAMALSNSEALAKQIRQLRNECNSQPASENPRTFRGIVRNGAVYPLEPGALAEGELVTITVA